LEIKNCKLQRLEKENKIVETSGKIVSAISTEMKNRRITPEVYHGRIFTATTSIKWLESHKVFTSFIPDTIIRDKWDHIFSLFYRICSKLLSSKQVEIQDRDLLYNDLEELGDVWVKEVDHKISPKLDTLIMVVPTVLNALDGNCGSLSEQSIERIHNRTKKEARRTYNIANVHERTKYIHQVRIYSNN
jgi:hypothetical protein